LYSNPIGMQLTKEEDINEVTTKAVGPCVCSCKILHYINIECISLPYSKIAINMPKINWAQTTSMFISGSHTPACFRHRYVVNLLTYFSSLLLRILMQFNCNFPCSKQLIISINILLQNLCRPGIHGASLIHNLFKREDESFHRTLINTRMRKLNYRSRAGRGSDARTSNTTVSN
jgi:hypothetical protein